MSDDPIAYLTARLNEDDEEIHKHPDDHFDPNGYLATRETNYPCSEILTIGKKRALAEVQVQTADHQDLRRIADRLRGVQASRP